MANINKIKLSGTTYNIQDENAQPLLTAGQGITIENNVISATGGGGGITSGEVETMIEDYMSFDVNTALFTATISASSIYITNGEITNVWSQRYNIPRYINYVDEFRIAGERSYDISALNLTQSFKDIYGNFDYSTIKGLGIIIKKSFYNKIPSQFKVNSGLFPVAKITSPITGMTNAWDVIPSLYNSYDWANFNGDSWDDVKDDDYLLVWRNIGGTNYHLENYTWGYESRWGVGYTTDSNTWGTYVVMFTTTNYELETPNVPYICPLFDADTWQNLYTGVTYSQASQKSYDGQDVYSINNTANSAMSTANSAMSTANSAMSTANSALTIAQSSVASNNLKTVNGTSLVQTGGGNVDVHGDWNENSSGSTNYIKNRPFYFEVDESSECVLACVPLDDEAWNMSYGCVETYTIQTTKTFSEGEKLGLAFIYENQYNCEYPQIRPQTIVNNSGTLTVGPYNRFTLTSSDGVNWTVTTNGSFCAQPVIFWKPTTVTYHTLDSNFIDSDIARTSAVTAEITAAVSGKVDTSSVVTAVTSASTDNEIPTAKAVYNAIPQGGGGKSVSGGTNISITTGETADTINCTLPIREGSNSNGKGIIVGDSECTATGLYGISLGHSSNASGVYSFCNGSNSRASGQMSFAHGDGCFASHDYSIMLGWGNRSTKEFQFSYGESVKPKNDLESGFGTYNNSSSATTTFGHSGNTLFSIGNGYDFSSTHNWHNAFEVRQNGDIYVPNTDDTSVTGDYAYSLYPMVRLQDTITATAANTTALGGLKLVKLTQSDYDALSTKDASTLYVIVN